MDVTIDDKDGQDDEPDVLTCEDFDPEEKANWESAGRIIKEEKRQLEIIKARAGIIPHDPQDDEPDSYVEEKDDPLVQSSLPPDPEGQNADRAEWAHRAILAFESATRTEREDALADLLCDLMHWANVYGQDFDRELSRATDSYAEEIEPEPDVFDQIAEHFKPIVAAEKVITIDPVEVAALADKLGEIL